MKTIKKNLILCLAIIIFNIGCASITNKGNIYKSGDFTFEIKYYDSCKGEKCYCKDVVKGDKYVCECIDTCRSK